MEMDCERLESKMMNRVYKDAIKWGEIKNS